MLAIFKYIHFDRTIPEIPSLKQQAQGVFFPWGDLLSLSLQRAAEEA